MRKTPRCCGHCMADTACSENPFCKDPSLDNRDKELTQPHCLGSAMHFQPSSGCSFGTERVSSGMGKTNVASQEQRPPFFAEGTLTPLPVCGCGPWHAASVNSTKVCLCVCVLYLSRNQNTSGPNLLCV